MNAKTWISQNCKFAQTPASPAAQCLELIKAGNNKEAAAFLRSQPEEQQGSIMEEVTRMIQSAAGGFAGWQQRQEAGQPEPAMPDLQGFWIEVKKLDRGWR